MNWKRAVFVTTMGAALVVAPAQAGAQCEGDFDGNNQVTVDELITAVGNSLSGCAPPVSILGVYEGPGAEILMGCMDPGDDGTLEIPLITLEVTQQNGSLYEATLSLTVPGEEPLSFDIEGTVDSEGVTQGMAFFPGPFPAGQFTGRLVGDILTISVRVEEQTCESAAASFIGTRD
jgi:hypothetical protein